MTNIRFARWNESELLQWVGLGALVAQLGAVGLSPSSPTEHWREPPYFAVLGDISITLLLVGLRFMRPRKTRLELGLLAAFLASMPLIYTWAAALGADAGGVRVEAWGVLVFWFVAYQGLKRPLWLALGIAAHGVAWDVWHWHRCAYIPSWYALGCSLADFGIGIYVATEQRTYERAWQ